MYIQLNSQIICYEKTGEGSPVILIHGNKEDHHIFDTLASKMESKYTVISMDLRGHGESAVPKEYHYADMADDVINLIDAISLQKPYIVGYSDGAIVAMLVAAKRSSRLGGIILCGGNMTPAGLTHSAIKEIKADYKKDPDPRTLLMLNEPNINEFTLGCIKTRALVVAGEKDVVKERETKKIAKSIPGAKLMILKGETHSSYIENADKLYEIIRGFVE